MLFHVAKMCQEYRKQSVQASSEMLLERYPIGHSICLVRTFV